MRSQPDPPAPGSHARWAATACDERTGTRNHEASPPWGPRLSWPLATGRRSGDTRCADGTHPGAAVEIRLEPQLHRRIVEAIPRPQRALPPAHGQPVHRESLCSIDPRGHPGKRPVIDPFDSDHFHPVALLLQPPGQGLDIELHPPDDARRIVRRGQGDPQGSTHLAGCRRSLRHPSKELPFRRSHSPQSPQRQPIHQRAEGQQHR